MLRSLDRREDGLPSVSLPLDARRRDRASPSLRGRARRRPAAGRHVLVARARRRRRRVHQQAAGRAGAGRCCSRPGPGKAAALRGSTDIVPPRDTVAGALLAATTGTSATGRRSTASRRRSCARSSRPSPTTIRNVVSSAGAQGLMQLLPETARLDGRDEQLRPAPEHHGRRALPPGAGAAVLPDARRDRRRPAAGRAR